MNAPIGDQTGSPEQPEPSGAEIAVQTTTFGPNYGLIGYAVALVIGSGALLWHVVGLPQVDLSRIGPGALVVTGLGLVLIGQVGLLRRRRRERRELRGSAAQRDRQR